MVAALELATGPVHVNLPFREPLTPTGEAVGLDPDVPVPAVSPTPPGHDPGRGADVGASSSTPSSEA